MNSDRVFQCSIHPRLDLTPEQFRALGASVQRWFAAASAPGSEVVAVAVDRDSLASLESGEPPPPVMLRHLDMIDAMRAARGMPPMTGAERSAAAAAWANTAGLTTEEAEEFRQLGTWRFLWVHARGEQPRIADSLRRAIPGELVKSIEVAGAFGQ